MLFDEMVKAGIVPEAYIVKKEQIEKANVMFAIHLIVNCVVKSSHECYRTSHYPVYGEWVNYFNFKAYFLRITNAFHRGGKR